ncbi:MAG: hypothetical protein NAOJABEB_03322 [Steroidobacteraceae bacterium]|nr:hypothetical protein [Steroidobacteraceae bacterium]
MATKLEKPLKRELAIGDVPYMITISPDGLKIVPKGRRNGLELTWKGILASQDGSGSTPGQTLGG